MLTRAEDKATIIPKQLKTPITEAQAATMGTVKDGGLVRRIDLLQSGRTTVVPFACCAINLDTRKPIVEVARGRRGNIQENVSDKTIAPGVMEEN